MVVCTFNFSTPVAEAGGSLNLNPVWSIYCVPGQPGLGYRVGGAGVGAHTFNPDKQEKERQGNLCEFKSSLVSIVRPRTTRTT